MCMFTLKIGRFPISLSVFYTISPRLPPGKLTIVMEESPFRIYVFLIANGDFPMSWLVFGVFHGSLSINMI